MFSFKKSLLLAALFPMFLAGCAGTVNAPKSAAQIEKIDFTPDSSPMPDSQSWIDKAIAGNHSAIFVLHMMYRDDIGNAKHLENGVATDNTLNAGEMRHERVRWLNRVADEHMLSSFVRSPTLFYQIPDLLETDDNDKEAITWLEEAAKRGYGNAEYVLGLFYWNGIIVPADKSKGFELIRRAAQHNIPNAQYHLGMIYELGLERPVDQKLANEWIQLALDNGNQDAVFILTMKYLDGIGVPKDPQKVKEIAENKDKKKHPWPKILRHHATAFDVICSFEYDQGEPGSVHDSDCGDEGDFDPEWHEMLAKMTDEERDRFFEEQALEAQLENTLEYGIDYELASRWLIQAAKDPNHIESQLQLARIQEADCRFNSDLDAPNAVELLTPLAEQQYPHTKYMLAEYYKEHSCNDSDSAKEALKWYIDADADNDKDATLALANIYGDERYNYECIIDENDIEEDYQKAYKYAKKGEARYTASFLAERIAENYLQDKNYPKAIEWYEKTIADKDDSDRGEYYLALGKIYDTGPDKIQDKTKAFEYYKEAGRRFRGIPAYIQVDLIRFAMLYDKGTDTIKPNKQLATEWYKRGLEAYYEAILNPDSDSGKLASTAQKTLLALPHIDLIDAVVDQIRLEEGKDPDQFFSIKSALKPCMESDRGEDDNCPMLDPLYDESIQKAMTAITAITLAKTGKLDKDIILNTYYDLAIIYGMDRSFKEKIRNYSPVYQKIHKETYFNLPFIEGNKIYNIWYLRQIPYAAAEVFKTLGNTSKAWDDYMKEAKKAVEGDEALKNGFEYSLLSAIPQQFITEPE